MSSSSGLIRVLLIAPTANVVGGQSVQAARLLAAFDGVPGLEVTFFPSDQPLPRVLEWVKRVRYLRTILNAVFYWSRLLRRARHADILHIFTPGLSAYTLWTIPAVLVARGYRKRSIVNYRDGRAEIHLKRFRTAKPTLLMADRVVTPSGYLVDIFARYGIPAQAIFNIIDARQFHYRLRRKLRPLFLTNRGLEPLYNVGCLLQAFAIIQKRYPDATFTIAHDGPCRRELEELAATLKLRHSHFIGCVPQVKIPDLYDAADIYMMSPNIDNMPGSVLECFAAGLPIITTSAGGIPYIATDQRNALLVGLGDHEAIAQCAFRLLEDEQLAERLSAAGREEIKRYDAARVRGDWLALYRELVPGGKAGGSLVLTPECNKGAGNAGIPG